MGNKITGWIKPDLVVAISAVIIALLALAVSVHEGIETRRHNRISVLPAFHTILIENYEADKIGILLENNGLGPGEFYKFRAIVDGTSYLIRTCDDLKNVLKKLNINKSWVTYRFFDAGSILKENEKCFIISVDNKKIDAARRRSFVNALERLDFQIEYKSMYNEIRVYNTMFSTNPRSKTKGKAGS